MSDSTRLQTSGIGSKTRDEKGCLCGLTWRSTRTPNFVRSLRSLLSVAGHFYVIPRATSVLDHAYE